MSLRDENKLKELEEWSRRTGVKPDRTFFSTDSELLYYPFCADFGPLNFGNIFRFCQVVNEKLAQVLVYIYIYIYIYIRVYVYVCIDLC